MIKKIMLKIVNWFWNIIYPEWSLTQVKEFYDKFSNYFELSAYLLANGFTYNADGMNILPIYRLDTFARPSQVLARKFGNCSDYMRLFSEFIRYKICADEFEELFLHNGEIGNWHYILKINDRNITYLQSNMHVGLATTEAWNEYKIEYKHIDIIDSWQR